MGVDSKTKYILWGRAAGHCELCAKPLDEGLYKMEGNYANVAHIKAQRTGGPRYDAGQTDGERHGIGNLMLLCHTCHKAIDDDDGFSVEWLLSKKLEREEAIAKFASNATIPQVDTISCFLPIAGRRKELEDSLWKSALFHAGLSFGDKKPFSMDSGVWVDGASLAEAAVGLENRFARWEETVHEDNPVAVFAMAPQPLLIKLGMLIGDKRVAHIFQWHRSRESWSWADSGVPPVFRVSTPSGDISVRDVNLVISVSGVINSRSIPVQQRSQPTIEMRAESPNVEIASCVELIDAFACELVDVVSSIHAAFPALERLHVFPAMPVSMAVKFGMVINMNLVKKLVVYEKSDALFHEALEMEPPHGRR